MVAASYDRAASNGDDARRVWKALRAAMTDDNILRQLVDECQRFGLDTMFRGTIEDLLDGETG